MSVERRLNKDQGFKKQKLAKTKHRRKVLDSARQQENLRSATRRNDLLPNLQVQIVDISGLRAASRRTRRLNEEHVVRLMTSISDLGFTIPILVADDIIVDGHVRLEAGRRLGLERVPAIDVSHVNAAERRKLSLAANRLGELGEWDLDGLHIEFKELLDLDIDLSATGFTVQEQDIILLDPQTSTEEHEIGEPSIVTVTRLGDVWILGGHKIICGSSLDPETYQALLDGELVQAVLTDPPYNVKIKGNVSGLGKKAHDEFAMASGEMDDVEWQAFLNDVMALLTSSVTANAVLFVFMDWRSIDRLYQAGAAAKLNLLNLAVWFKESGAMGTLYRSAHELVAVFCKGDKPRINNVELGKNGRDRCNVWRAPGANRRGSSASEMLALHATPKPVELCTDALLDVTERGDTVLDAFLGSGTTLIACENTGRHARGIEIEPKFVDVAVHRWEQITGRKATLAATDETFNEVAVRRAAENHKNPYDETEI